MCWHSNHLFTVYVLVELKEPLHCSQAAERMCVQIFFWPIPSSTALASSVHSQSRAVQVPMAHQNTRFLEQKQLPTQGFCLKVTLLPPLYSWFFIILFQPPLWLFRTKSRCCTVTGKNYKSDSVRTLEKHVDRSVEFLYCGL